MVFRDSSIPAFSVSLYISSVFLEISDIPVFPSNSFLFATLKNLLTGKKEYTYVYKRHEYYLWPFLLAFFPPGAPFLPLGAQSAKGNRKISLSKN